MIQNDSIDNKVQNQQGVTGIIMYVPSNTVTIFFFFLKRIQGEIEEKR